MGARGARVALCGVALLCALGLGQRPLGDLSCSPGQVLHGTGTDARCCLCAPGKAGGSPCAEGGSAASVPCSGQAFWVQSPDPSATRRRQKWLGDWGLGVGGWWLGGGAGAGGVGTFPKTGQGSQRRGGLSLFLLSG